MTPAEESGPPRVSHSDKPILRCLSTLNSIGTHHRRRHLALIAILLATALAVGIAGPRQALADPSAIPFAALQGQEAPDQATDATADPGVVEDQGVTPDPGSTVDSDATDAGPDPAQDDGTGERIIPTSRGGPRPTGPSTAGDRVAEVARKYVGFPYAWGGASPRTGFDCSGFDEYVYREAGIADLPHDLWGQMNTGPRVSLEELQPGDLVFFQNTYKAGLSHGGVYLGNGQFIHSIEEGVGVQVTSLGEGYWAARFLAASRPWVTNSDSGQ